LAVEAVKNYKPTNNRSQWMLTAKNRLIIDAYNANPTSMAAALDNFEQLQSSHKAVILGDMLELGADSVSEHGALVERINNMQKNGKIEQLFLVGPRLGNQFADVNELKNFLSKNPLTNATILIKGSRGMRLEQVLEVL